MPNVDSDWFKGRISELGISQRVFAKRVGMDPASLTLTFQGKRKISISRAAVFARELGVTLDDVVLHGGIEYGVSEGDRIKIVGFIDGAARVDFDGKTHGSVPALAHCPPDSVALVMRTTQTDLDAMNGWVVFAGPRSEDVAGAVDRTAIVKLHDEPTPLMRLVRRGSTAVVHTLTGIAQPPIYDVQIEWLRLILAFRPL